MDTVPEKIVVLEADQPHREAMSAALRDAGYDVAAFATSREGLDAIHSSGADVLLLDSGLQDPSASETLATLRGATETSGISIILLVGPRQRRTRRSARPRRE